MLNNLYTFCVPVFLRGHAVLSELLRKGEAHAAFLLWQEAVRASPYDEVLAPRLRRSTARASPALSRRLEWAITARD